MTDIVKHSEYRDWLRDLKQQIKIGQIKAALSVNSQMIMLYWDLGRQITEKQEKAQWGSGFIEQLSNDLKEEFPEMKGFSYDNLRFIKRFYQFYAPISEQLVPKLQLIDYEGETKPEQVAPILEAQVVPQLQTTINQYDIIWKQLVSKLVSIPWGHHIKIMQKIKDLNQALFYVNKTIENNWSRAVLEYQIEADLYGRQGKAVTNFSLTTKQSVRIASFGRRKMSRLPRIPLGMHLSIKKHLKIS